MDDERKSRAGIAAVLSFVFNGLGQIYNGQIKKGLFIVFLSSLSMLIFIIGAILIAYWMLGKSIISLQIIYGLLFFCLGLLLICILGIWAILDAHNVAKKY